MGAGESRGQLQGLFQGTEGFTAAGRHLGVARLDAVELLLDQEDLLTCRTTQRSGNWVQPGYVNKPCAECIKI